MVCEQATTTWALADSDDGPKLRQDTLTVRLTVRTHPDLPRYAEAVLAAVKVHLKLFCSVDLANVLIVDPFHAELLASAPPDAYPPCERYKVLPAELTAQNIAAWFRPIFDRMFGRYGFYRLEGVEIMLLRGGPAQTVEVGQA